jgi:hypothetical protein
MPAPLRQLGLFTLLCAALASLAAFAPSSANGSRAVCKGLSAGSWVHLEYCHPMGLASRGDTCG